LVLAGDLHGVSLAAGAFVMVLRLAGRGSEPGRPPDGETLPGVPRPNMRR